MPQTLKGNWFNCRFCNKLIYRSLGEQRKSPLKKFICSKKCSNINIKVRARQITYNAKIKGLLKVPLNCERCGVIDNLQAHHNNYNQPLMVEWICRSCHDKEHYNIRVQLIEKRRKHLIPCECGKPAIAKGKCATCYNKYRSSIIKELCNIPGCNSKAHCRGLCDKHRQNKIFNLYLLQPKKRGPKSSIKITL